MNIALVALPRSGKPVTPPLTLAYMATLLDQRRHIVRIYDLALSSESSLTTDLQPLRLFRPQQIVVFGEHTEQLTEFQSNFHGEQRQILPVVHCDDLLTSCVCGDILSWIDLPSHMQADQMIGVHRSNHPISLDDMALPARHLLSLEQYELRAIGGELQTTVLIAQSDCGSGQQISLRAPTHIVAELRSVSREFGFRHYLFPRIPLTLDLQWLHEFLTRLIDANLMIGWEAQVDGDLLDETLIEKFASSGCEMLCFDLDAARVFESTENRSHLKQVIAAAREHGIFTRANVRLEAPYETIMNLVDVAATFGLDDVVFNAAAAPHYEAIAKHLYHVGRDRQRLIGRFGQTLGNLLWKLQQIRWFPGNGDDFEMGPTESRGPSL